MEPFATTGEEIAAVNELPESERLVYERLSSVPIHIDEIIRDLHLTAQVVSVALTMLELKGLAENMGAMQYCLQRR
jgi:predicted Rossmann fold nucleotide-binding protein DprA/Smf involved in DNA uptake